jgi:hypothetical protein
MTDLFLGDDSYHGGAFMLRRASVLCAVLPPAAESDAAETDVPFDFRHAGQYKFYLERRQRRQSGQAT